jgi:hypothetical protein
VFRRSANVVFKATCCHSLIFTCLLRNDIDDHASRFLRSMKRSCSIFHSALVE